MSGAAFRLYSHFSTQFKKPLPRLRGTDME